MSEGQASVKDRWLGTTEPGLCSALSVAKAPVLTLTLKVSNNLHSHFSPQGKAGTTVGQAQRTREAGRKAGLDVLEPRTCRCLHATWATGRGPGHCRALTPTGSSESHFLQVIPGHCAENTSQPGRPGRTGKGGLRLRKDCNLSPDNGSICQDVRTGPLPPVTPQVSPEWAHVNLIDGIKTPAQSQTRIFLFLPS